MGSALLNLGQSSMLLQVSQGTYKTDILDPKTGNPNSVEILFQTRKRACGQKRGEMRRHDIRHGKRMGDKKIRDCRYVEVRDGGGTTATDRNKPRDTLIDCIRLKTRLCESEHTNVLHEGRYDNTKLHRCYNRSRIVR